MSPSVTTPSVWRIMVTMIAVEPAGSGPEAECGGGGVGLERFPLLAGIGVATLGEGAADCGAEGTPPARLRLPLAQPALTRAAAKSATAHSVARRPLSVRAISVGRRVNTPSSRGTTLAI